MLAPQALIRGVVSRFLPSPMYDDRDRDTSIRFGRYGELVEAPLVRKSASLCDEGAYFVTHNAQTAIASATTVGTTFSQTTNSPLIIITNTDTGDRGKSIYLDYIHMIVTTAATAASAATNISMAFSLDQSITRWSSGGTDLTGAPATNGGTFNTNTGAAKRTSISQVNIGALTLNAASANAKIVVPQRTLRPLNSTTVLGAISDHYHINFGGVEEQSYENDIGTAQTTARKNSHTVPPLIIGPQHCGIMHIFSPGAAFSGALSAIYEIGFWER
jgi:hypothetical protein